MSKGVDPVASATVLAAPDIDDKRRLLAFSNLRRKVFRRKGFVLDGVRLQVSKYLSCEKVM